MTDTKENPGTVAAADRGENESADQTNQCREDIEMNYTTKKGRVLAALMTSEGLNRFEAERIGDHCLNSTVSTLRREGWRIIGEPEKVPSRFTRQGVRVLRYHCMGVK